MTSESSGEQAYGHGMQRTCVWLFVWFDVLRPSQQRRTVYITTYEDANAKADT